MPTIAIQGLLLLVLIWFVYELYGSLHQRRVWHSAKWVFGLFATVLYFLSISGWEPFAYTNFIMRIATIVFLLLSIGLGIINKVHH